MRNWLSLWQGRGNEKYSPRAMQKQEQDSAFFKNKPTHLTTPFMEKNEVFPMAAFVTVQK